MKCIYCNHKKTDITNTRPTNGNESVWRRRQCLKCLRIFTTKEESLSDNLFVLKRNKSRQRFVYEKLFVSIFTSLQIGKYNDNGDLAKLSRNMTLKILKQLFKAGELNVKTSSIIKLAYKALKTENISAGYKYRNYSKYRIEVLRDEL
ncbi:hypothetical protein H7X65_03100 [Candidatus Parcubacteria bacterium]|nr:hypothetical protein [Candidatus Parcubacteria bacterium]